MGDGMDLAGVDEPATFDIADESILLPAVPQGLDDRCKFLRALIAALMRDRLFKAEIPALREIGAGDDVPADATAARMVERREATGDIIGLVIGGGGCRDQADMLGMGRNLG